VKSRGAQAIGQHISSKLKSGCAPSWALPLFGEPVQSDRPLEDIAEFVLFQIPAGSRIKRTAPIG
jgi:hypothetical protein